MINKKRIGVSILLVNSDKSDIKEIDNSIKNTFTTYQNSIRGQLISAESKYYEPIVVDLFGYFDKAYIYLNDDFELSNKYLHPCNVLIPDNDNMNEMYSYKIITGNIMYESANRLYEALENAFSKRNDEYYFFLTRIKINSLHLLCHGGKFINGVKQIIKEKYSKEDKKEGIYVVESFGFHELVVFSFWDDIDAGTKFLFETSELNINDKQLNNKQIDFNNKSYNLLDMSSTIIGHLSDGEMNSKEWQLQSTLGIKPGYSKVFLKKVDELMEGENIDFNLMLGWQDLISLDLYKNFTNNKAHEFISKIKPYTDSIYTIVTKKLDDKEKSELLEKSGNANIPNKSVYKVKPFEKHKLRKLVDRLSDVGLNQVVTQRCINSILNFNKCISERESYPYFIHLWDYLDIFLFGYVEMFYELYVQKIQTKKGYDFMSIGQFETELITIVKGFENAFNNRYIHSKELAETSDTNHSYRGGIQQYLFIYEFLLSEMSKEIFQSERSGVSLYVSAYSQTVSYSYYMRMNIFQVYNPGLFLVVVSHEISIHMYNRFIMQSFQKEFNPNKEKDLRFLESTKLSIKEIMEGMKMLGYDKEENKSEENPYYKLLFDRFDESKDDNSKNKKDEENKYRNEQLFRYLLTDKITLCLTFFNNYELFVYWHLIYFYQLYGDRRETNFEFVGHLRTLYLRFYMLLYHHKGMDSSQDYKNELKNIISKVIVEEGVDYQFFKAVSDAKEIIANQREENNFVNKIYRNVVNNKCREIKSDSLKTYDYRSPKIIRKDDIEISEVSFMLRERGYSYLKFYLDNFPRVIFTDDSDSYFEPLGNKEDNNAVHINRNGGMYIVGDKKREEVYNVKINYLQNIWHLSYLIKGQKIS